MKANENPLANGIVDIDVYTFLYVQETAQLCSTEPHTLCAEIILDSRLR